MIISVENRQGPCQVFDGNGNKIEYVVWCNTETGKVRQFVLKDGRLVIDKRRKEVRKQNRTYPAPLQVVWLQQVPDEN